MSTTLLKSGKTSTLSVITALILCSFLTGCAGGIFSGSDADELAVPDVVVYSKETQNKAADELEMYPVPVVTEMMKDYGVMRDQAKSLKN